MKTLQEEVVEFLHVLFIHVPEDQWRKKQNAEYKIWTAAVAARKQKDESK